MSQKTNPKNFLNFFSQGINNLIIVDLSFHLKLLDLELKNEIKVNALDIVELNQGEKEGAVVSAIQNFISRNKILHKNAILIPSFNNLFVRRLQLPNLPESEIIEAIRLSIKDEITFDISKTVIDYQIVKKGSAGDGSKFLDIICIVAEEEEIKKQVLFLKAAGLTCVSVGLIAFGYAKFIENLLDEDKSRPLAILHIAENTSTIAVYKENNIVFFRRLPFSIRQLKDSLAATVVTEKGKAQLSEEEARDILFSHGIPINGTFFYKDKISSVQILALLRPNLELLAQEIKRSLEYYDSEFQDEPILKIMVCGEAIGIPSLDKFLSKEISLNFSIIKSLDRIKAAAGVDLARLAESYADIGLATGYEKTINLLPREFRTEKIEKFQKVSLRWISFVAFLLFVVFYFLAKTGVGAYQKRLDNTLFQLNVLSEIKQIKTRLDAFDLLNIEVKNKEARVASILVKLSNLSPRQLFFNTLTINSEARTGSISGFVKGSDFNPDAVLAKFIDDLEKTGYFQEINILQVTKGASQGLEVANFELNLKLK